MNINKSKLMRALKVCSDVLKDSGKLTDYSGMCLISVDTDKTTITASNGINSVLICVNDNNINKERYIVNAKKLAEILTEGAGNGDVVEISKKEGDERVIVKVGENTIFKINTADASKYPIPTFEQGDSFSIENQRLIDLIKKTAFILESSEKTYSDVLHIVIEDGKVEVSATDGVRLINIQSPIEYVGERIEINLSSSAARTLLKILELYENELSIVSVLDSKMSILTSEVTATFQMIRVNYPDYKKIICMDDTYFTVECDIEQIKKSLKRAKAIQDVVKIEVKKESLHLSIDGDAGEFEDEVQISAVDKDLKIGINQRYILDILQNAEDVKMMVSEKPLKPVFLTGKEYLAVVMPVNIN